MVDIYLSLHTKFKCVCVCVCDLGTKLKSEIPLLDLPVGLCSFHMDTTIPQTPAVAVASGNFVYIYKGLRPYFRFTLPTLEV